jgi:uncharacterized membrane-anchored protein
MISGRGPDSARLFEEAKARADERQTRRMSIGTVQASQRARSLAGWIFTAIAVGLLGGAAYLTLGPLPAAAVVIVLIALIFFVRRTLR